MIKILLQGKKSRYLDVVNLHMLEKPINVVQDV